MCKSVPQMPVHKARIFTSLIPGSGSGTSANHRPQAAWLFTRAFIPAPLEDNRSNKNGRAGYILTRHSLSSHFLSCREKLRPKDPHVRRFTRWNGRKDSGQIWIRGQTIEGI